MQLSMQGRRDRTERSGSRRNRAAFPRGRFQFTLGSMMLLAAGCAVILGAWRAFTHEPVTHKIKLYEHATGTKSLAIQVGDHQLRIRSVSRNKRDGSTQSEDGHGRVLANAHVQAPPIPTNAASWLDVAQIEFEAGPDELEIIQSRIFEHATRKLVYHLNEAFGWRMVQPHVLQLYGLSRELPEKLDIWLRVNSYDPTYEVTLLSAKPGSSIEIEGGNAASR